VTRIDGQQVLLSWSGTMFEYLMPDLLIQDCEGTFLYESSHGAVDAQIAYGRQKHIPWGMSESGYYAFDANSNYQYRGFGLPWLGFKRNLSDDLVIAPYASLLALPVRPGAVLQNMAHLSALGMLGQYGFYEALDFTASRLPLGQRCMKIQSYMTHHQAMILLTLTNYLRDYVMIQRFHTDPRVKSVELLLQERVPQQAPAEFPHQNDVRPRRLTRAPMGLTPWKVSVDSPAPAAHILSHGDYGVLITAAGAGYSQWQEIALTRWRADTTLENDGMWIYVQDRENGALWSATYQPTAVKPDNQEVLFYPHKVEFRRVDHKIGLRMEVSVAPDEAVEIRRITLINHTDQARRLALTSYGEVVLAPQATDQRHQAFSKLFIESEYVQGASTLLFRRRPRASTEKSLYLAHTLIVEQGSPSAYETDRARFLGRGGTLRAPSALTGGGLSGTTGATLDPIMALSAEIDLEPHGTTQLAFLTMVAESRAEVLALAAHYQAWLVLERALEQSRAQSERDLRERNLAAHNLEQMQQLLSPLLYPHPALRAAPSILATNTRGQPGLWAYGISGDYPILLVHI
jgi:cyclic beta-1,2-glucan synthetase